MNTIDLTILMPCLNEEETLAVCINKAYEYINRSGVAGEVLIADNGSSDRSIQIAKALGARVIEVNERGYGAALFHGSNAAFGKFIIMGDSDDSYDFSNLEVFLEKFSQGYDFVVGNRFKRPISPGAMPWKNRWIGNPMLSLIGRILFRCPVGDFHCGLRGISKSAFLNLGLRTRGMEYASEMVIKATHLNLKIAEVAITLHKDGRSRRPHLRPWRDGWRHLRFLLILSPQIVFINPGILALGISSCVYLVVLLSGYQIHGIQFGVNTGMALLGVFVFGYLMLLSGIFIKAFIEREGLLLNIRSKGTSNVLYMEIGLITSFFMFLSSYLLFNHLFAGWKVNGFGDLSLNFAMTNMLFSVLLLLLGVITVVFSFFAGALSLPKRQ